MGGLLPDDDSSTTPVSITVLSVTPVRAGRLFALASVAIDIDGVPIQIHGIRAMHVPQLPPGSNCRPSATPPADRGQRSCYQTRYTAPSVMPCWMSWSSAALL